jgi:hypothetical protein
MLEMYGVNHEVHAQELLRHLCKINEDDAKKYINQE